MSIVSFSPARDQLSFTFGGVEPVMRVKPGTVLSLWTEDAYCGRILSADDHASTALVANELNPQTGPFFIEVRNPATPSPSTSLTSLRHAAGARPR